MQGKLWTTNLPKAVRTEGGEKKIEEKSLIDAAESPILD
jgi:hypothetical protein